MKDALFGVLLLQMILHKREFECLVKEHHRGIVLKNSQINRSPWMDWVFYGNDEFEEALCNSSENLDKYLLLINN